MIFSVKDVARVFAVSENAVQRWVREQNLPAVVASGQLRFQGSELLEWATARKMRVPLELFANGNNGHSAPPFAHLQQALRRGGILPRVPGSDKCSVLSAVAERIPFLSAAERQELSTLLLGRERAGTTAVGDGIAIPHPAHPLVLAGGEPSITLCYLDQPVDFAAADHLPVHALFVLLATNVRNHLMLLAELASALHDQSVRQAVQKHAGQSEFLRVIERLCEKIPVPVSAAKI